jgi:hypothetical protein
VDRYTPHIDTIGGDREMSEDAPESPSVDKEALLREFYFTEFKVLREERNAVNLNINNYFRFAITASGARFAGRRSDCAPAGN